MCTDVWLRALFVVVVVVFWLYLSAGFTCSIWKSLPMSILLVSLDFNTNTRKKMNVLTCNIMGRPLSTRCKRGVMSYYFLYYCFFWAVFHLLNHVFSEAPGLLVICSLDQRKVSLSSISISFLSFRLTQTQPYHKHSYCIYLIRCFVSRFLGSYRIRR